MTTTSSGTATVTLPADNQILITARSRRRRHLVYRAWTASSARTTPRTGAR